MANDSRHGRISFASNAAARLLGFNTSYHNHTSPGTPTKSDPDITHDEHHVNRKRGNHHPIKQPPKGYFGELSPTRNKSNNVDYFSNQQNINRNNPNSMYGNTGNSGNSSQASVFPRRRGSTGTANNQPVSHHAQKHHHQQQQQQQQQQQHQQPIRVRTNESLMHSINSNKLHSKSRKTVINVPFSPQTLKEQTNNNHTIDVYQQSSSASNSQIHSHAHSPKESNIRVVVRIRPLTAKEIEDKSFSTCSTNSESSNGTMVLVKFPPKNKEKQFTFDQVCNARTDQSILFQTCGIIKLLDASLRGYCSTIFAYGQTGSGKTYSICGENKLPYKEYAIRSSEIMNSLVDQNAGLIPRSIIYIWNQIQNIVRYDQTQTFILRAGYLEIYNEKPRDLLNPNVTSINVRWNSEMGFFVENQLLVRCLSLQDLFAVFDEGETNRETGSHEINNHSSRSHCLFSIHIESKKIKTNQPSLIQRGKITFVDLAGSEKLKDSKQSSDKGKRETANINTSLFTLGKVISMLDSVHTGKISNKTAHIPYRDSVLTKLLMDSIGGSGMAIMLACVSPASKFFDDTVSTLSYASRARNIKNKPTVNINARDRIIAQLLEEVKRLKAENIHLKKLLKNPNVYSVPGQHTMQSGHAFQRSKLGRANTLQPSGLSSTFSFQPISTRNNNNNINTTNNNNNNNNTHGQIDEPIQNIAHSNFVKEPPKSVFNNIKNDSNRHMIVAAQNNSNSINKINPITVFHTISNVNDNTTNNNKSQFQSNYNRNGIIKPLQPRHAASSVTHSSHFGTSSFENDTQTVQLQGQNHIGQNSNQMIADSRLSMSAPQSGAQTPLLNLDNQNARHFANRPQIQIPIHTPLSLGLQKHNNNNNTNVKNNNGNNPKQMHETGMNQTGHQYPELEMQKMKKENTELLRKIEQLEQQIYSNNENKNINDEQPKKVSPVRRRLLIKSPDVEIDLRSDTLSEDDN